MTTFFSSDWHLDHARIIELSGRPFATVADMNRALIDNANRDAGPDDTIIFVGDMAMGTIIESLPLFKQIEAKMVLIPGNHDRISELYEHKRPERRLEWIPKYEEVGFEIWPDTVAYAMGGADFDICHFPYAGDSHDEDRFANARPQDGGRWLLHGHVHEAWRVKGRQINVGVDAWAGRLVRWDTLVGLACAAETELAPLPWTA